MELATIINRLSWAATGREGTRCSIREWREALHVMQQRTGQPRLNVRQALSRARGEWAAQFVVDDEPHNPQAFAAYLLAPVESGVRNAD